MNTDRLCLFTDTGKLHTLKVLDLPYGKFRDKGNPIDNVCNYDSSEENLIFIESLAFVKSHNLLFTTKYGMMKMVEGVEMEVAKKTVAATKLGDEDVVLSITPIENMEDHIVLQTKQDVFLRFPASEIPYKKKGAIGVRGIKLGAKDELTALYLLNEDNSTVVDIGKKEVHLNRLKIARRDTKGTKAR